MKFLKNWGVVDVDYPVTNSVRVNGVKRHLWICPYYQDWRDMVNRVTYGKYNYRLVSICEEWKYLSNFIKWVDSQPNRDWQNCCLDKDLLEGKEYSPNNSVYLTQETNKFILDNPHMRKGMIGTYYNNKNKKFISQIKLAGVTTYLGSYQTELEAHKTWQAKKHEYACLLAEQQQDPRVAKALRERYAPDKDWTQT